MVGYQGIPGLLFLVCELQMVFYIDYVACKCKKKTTTTKNNYNLSQGLLLPYSGMSTAFYELFDDPWKLVKKTGMSDSDRLMAIFQCPSIFSYPFFSSCLCRKCNCLFMVMS